ncbi:hypothetical protein N6H18_05890 [Reichenbachiella agarivorans]|uniref:Uncharacterized protein n=1 Tax=Reichenbachiella agarivorans TaxID=2979464 RepID=A0ABY6CSJ3_9BACT|nr:hypothetical protein [Reichenbachiella agarivorans]UXP33482.1 hypothetical protein N6H18_05890 [Reichenbachiella agarivorans]
MTKLFTEVDLIRYIYGETSQTEDDEIQNAIVCNLELGEMLSQLELDTQVLDRLLLNPSPLSLKHIFEYSANYSLNQKV